MSNIAFITTRKHIKSYNILYLLEQINKNKFCAKLKITETAHENIPHWDIEYGSDRNDGLTFRIKSPKMLGCKHPHSTWWSYVMLVFSNEFAIMTNGMLSDEGIEEHWAPGENEYKSYIDYICRFTSHYADDLKEAEVKYYMVSCPEEMRQY